MRSAAVLLVAAILCSASARASVCDPDGRRDALRAGWTVDHFIYDASLQRDWEVLVDCSRPSAPARIELTRPGSVVAIFADAGRHRGIEKAVRPPAAYRIVKAGDAVEVFSSEDDPARIMLSGIAMQSGLAGQLIRVRLRASGRFVSGIARGPHSVELAAVGKPSWREP